MLPPSVPQTRSPQGPRALIPPSYPVADDGSSVWEVVLNGPVARCMRQHCTAPGRPVFNVESVISDGGQHGINTLSHGGGIASVELGLHWRDVGLRQGKL